MNQELKDVQEEFRRKLAEDNRDGLDMVRLQLKKEKKFLSDKPCRNIADTLDVLGQTIAPWDKEISMGVYGKRFFCRSTSLRCKTNHTCT